jgi:hypothetical protein
VLVQLNPGCSFALQPGQSCTTTVILDGTHGGTPGPFTVTLTAGAPAGQTATATLSATIKQPWLVATPVLHDFGTLSLFTTATFDFTLTNNRDEATGPFTSRISVTTPDFTVVGSTCTAGGLDPHSSCVVTVQFRARLVGTQVTGALDVVGAGGSLTIPLSGTTR